MTSRVGAATTAAAANCTSVVRQTHDAQLGLFAVVKTELKCQNLSSNPLQDTRETPFLSANTIDALLLLLLLLLLAHRHTAA